MKKILFKILLLIPILSYASNIEHDMSYKQMDTKFDVYLIKGAGEECEVTVGNKEWIDTTTCLSLTNSKGIKILCTKKKKMCKTESEFLNFVNPLGTAKDTSENTNEFRVLKRWVNAHNIQDMNEIKNLYSNKITYYGKKLPRNKCIKDKKRVLSKYPQFRVRTDNIEYISVTPTITKVTFDKYVKFSSKKKEKMYPSYLLVDLASNLILVEGDTVTDKNIKKNKVTYVTTKGTEFKTKFNEHGAVLKSKSLTIYLGNDCDASSPQFGNGSWDWANAGFSVYFENKEIIFGNYQELLIENDGKCSSSGTPYAKPRNEVKPLQLNTPHDNLSQKELCKIAEDNFSKSYEIFTNAQLDPKETSDSTFKKQLKARDLALSFMQQCKNVYRNVLWHGGYSMKDIEQFIRQTNAVERLGNDIDRTFQ